MEKEQPNYYAILTADIRYDKRLTADEKLLYAEITALSNKTGQCWATNKYFSECYGVAQETISRRIAKLVKLGFVKRVVIYKENSKEIDKRILYPLTLQSIPIDGSINTPIDGNINTPIDGNVKDNITSINTTSNNKPLSSFDLFMQQLKEKATIKSKVTTTKETKKLFDSINDKSTLMEDYLSHQEEKGEYSKKITPYFLDYESLYKRKSSLDEWR